MSLHAALRVWFKTYIYGLFMSVFQDLAKHFVCFYIFWMAYTVHPRPFSSRRGLTIWRLQCTQRVLPTKDLSLVADTRACTYTCMSSFQPPISRFNMGQNLINVKMSLRYRTHKVMGCGRFMSKNALLGDYVYSFSHILVIIVEDKISVIFH